MTPLVGLSSYRQEATWGSWTRPAVLLPVNYGEMVATVGGRPVVLPPVESGAGPAAGADEAVAKLDALVLIGGEDVGENPLRCASERALLAAALARDLPVLAICRGHQVLNVHLGGSLIPHLPDVVGHERHRPARGIFGRMAIEAVPGSRVVKAMGESFTVSCSHHQAIDRVGADLVVTARSEDGVIEAVELESASFVVGVQWHPEEDGDTRLFVALIEAAEGRR